MNIKELKELIDIITSKESIEELEIEKSGVRLRIKRSSNNFVTSAPAVAPAAGTSTSIPAPEAPAAPNAPVQADPDDLVYIKSPMVGTFFAAASPTADPFVSTGSVVQKGTVLCIVEAMKLMNEIESEVNGRVKKILAESTKPVEYGQALFLVDPTATP